ncbi:hypothetical protein [Acanthamoeba polyphaga mimivirus]|uniref:Uncharacterized protein n=3 Tax=Megamimivirinae TaxID=3044648 RepID=A0A2L2DKR8_MIMIV|nr:hypothetical protein MegaChil _gp1018 [Megavirus chiliensis]AEQ33055.1 Nitrogen regulatory P-II family protein like [Megavirus chiliensis]AGD92991.1 hypothetical protein LBA_01073 [Megavirus lba]AVG46737.1 hypothetical protein [Acanthamoeba polyphaga mimivirus]AVG47856.1 hypothetical protein [Acanthamoeba polyphaga mimivirus]
MIGYEMIIIIGMSILIIYLVYIIKQKTLFVSNNIKIVIFVPEEYADIVRKIIGEAGAGHIDMYDHCSFSMNGIGRYRSLAGSNPTIGEIGQFSSSTEIRIETICPANKVKQIISEAKKIHPYETMGYDLYPLLEIS